VSNSPTLNLGANQRVWIPARCNSCERVEFASGVREVSSLTCDDDCRRVRTNFQATQVGAVAQGFVATSRLSWTRGWAVP